eukprot:gene15706-21816_t
MLCSLTVAGTWLFLATFMKLPVSTTHSIIGAIMGFSLVYGGWTGVLWNEEQGNFPFSKGFLPVVLSWFFSPIIGGILGAIFFSLIKFIILRHDDSTERAVWFLPVVLFITVFIDLMFVLAAGAKDRMQETWPCKEKQGRFNLMYDDCSDLYSAAAWISAATAAGVAFIGGAIGIPILRQKLTRTFSIAEGQIVKSKIPLPPLMWAKPTVWCMVPLRYAAFPVMFIWRQVNFGLFYLIHNAITQSAVSEMGILAEQFHNHTDRIYEFLQVISASCLAFAHGSNDVANSVGPFSAIFFVYENWGLPGSKTHAPKWIFVFGGVGIVLGLVIYGYHIIKDLGCKHLHLTPSRRFSAELAAGLIISLSSFFGIPVSTTQIITGAGLGVGLCQCGYTPCNVNWKLFAKIFFGWILTIILNLASCACLFSMGAYAPSVIQTQQLRDIRQSIMQNQMLVIRNLNSTNAALSGISMLPGGVELLRPLCCTMVLGCLMY